MGAATNKEELKRLNITHVLVVAKSIGLAYPDDFVYKAIEGTEIVQSSFFSRMISNHKDNSLFSGQHKVLSGNAGSSSFTC